LGKIGVSKPLTQTVVECHKALSDMTNNKMPGSEGFSVEFYKFFWADMRKVIGKNRCIKTIDTDCSSLK